MNSSLEYTLNLTGSLASEKLGITTTVKEQVENIEIALETFKRSVDQQKKLQSQLQIQLKKLDQKTHKDFNDMLQQTTTRAGQLSDIFRHQNDRQNKEFQFLEVQTNILTEQHGKMNDVGQDIGFRTNEVEKKVGV